MDSQKSFGGPSVFFMCVMIIGNFMLLNLFLAILLKSISGNEEEDEDEVEPVEQVSPVKVESED
jgi:hypothetical protein